MKEARLSPRMSHLQKIMDESKASIFLTSKVMEGVEVNSKAEFSMLAYQWFGHGD